jgi:hypothetical protein
MKAEDKKMSMEIFTNKKTVFEKSDPKIRVNKRYPAKKGSIFRIV